MTSSTSDHPPLVAELIAACASDDLLKVRSMLQAWRSSSENRSPPPGPPRQPMLPFQPALQAAARTGNADIVAFLLEEGCQVDRGETWSALELGSMHASVPTLAVLLSNGAEVRNTSALIWAARHGRTDNVNFLLDNGALIDEIPDNDRIYDNAREHGLGTALHAAAERGQREVVRLLLERGADKSIKDSRMRTPREVALENGCSEMVEML
ncbi:MAG: hypothetical protein M1816_002470 [Peltula sp. TS41687]|nr:MAG: hypothetical protein M1816_002470 [Peltula sp. TS41687]